MPRDSGGFFSKPEHEGGATKTSVDIDQKLIDAVFKLMTVHDKTSLIEEDDSILWAEKDFIEMILRGLKRFYRIEKTEQIPGQEGKYSILEIVDSTTSDKNMYMEFSKYCEYEAEIHISASSTQGSVNVDMTITKKKEYQDDEYDPKENENVPKNLMAPSQRIETSEKFVGQWSISEEAKKEEKPSEE